MLSWHSTARRDGIQVVSDDGDWTILMMQPMTLEWNLYRNKERAGQPTDPAFPSSVSYREFVSQHTRLDHAMQAAEDAAAALTGRD
jgi:hypothetical protein